MQDYPLTERHGQSLEVWAQAEYVSALRRNIGFSAHGNMWYYNNGGKVSAYLMENRPVMMWRGDCLNTSNWIEYARRRTGHLAA